PFNQDPMILRMVAAAAILAQAASLAFLATETKPSRLRAFSLALVAAGLIAWGWSMLNISAPAVNRDTIVVVVMAVLTRLYGLTLARRSSESRWAAAAKQVTPWLVAVYVAFIFLTIATEALRYPYREDLPAVFVIAIALIDMLISVLRFAM